MKFSFFNQHYFNEEYRFFKFQLDYAFPVTSVMQFFSILDYMKQEQGFQSLTKVTRANIRSNRRFSQR